MSHESWVNSINPTSTAQNQRLSGPYSFPCSGLEKVLSVFKSRYSVPVFRNIWRGVPFKRYQKEPALVPKGDLSGSPNGRRHLRSRSEPGRGGIRAMPVGKLGRGDVSPRGLLFPQEAQPFAVVRGKQTTSFTTKSKRTPPPWRNRSTILGNT